jgi:hypothetical protein
LRCFVHDCPSKWLYYLPLAEFWYNTSIYSAIGRSPFEALYGHSPGTFGITGVDSILVDSIDQWLHERSVMQDLIKQYLGRAQLHMKHQADRGQSEREFHEGDQVFLKLQPYIQSSLVPRSNKKLALSILVHFLFYIRLERWLISWLFLSHQRYTWFFTFPC